MDYKDTLNLPKTDFPMKANLGEQEPKRLERWEKGGLYEKVLKARDKSKPYILHDGPPYANGNIHIGTALNKILKDIIVKTKLGFGFYSPYVPGWDCHGLPIEHKVDKELGDKKLTASKSDIRKQCRAYASHWIDVQRESFKRLGVLGDWSDPYITMKFPYEAATLTEFYKVYNSGGVYKGMKPVYWCTSCVTALAEAEVEYAEHTSTSIYVKFPFTKDTLEKAGFKEPISAVIWTTTPWTLPANLAVALHPQETYAAVRIEESLSSNLKQGELILLAAPLIKDELQKALKVTKWSVEREIDPKRLDRLTLRHPFIDRTSLIIMGEHVLMTDGTGLVHTAPGHGQEDYAVGRFYGLEIYNPVDDYGKYRKDAPVFAGEDINDAGKKITALMEENGTLIAHSRISHSYPHCWRCKKPVIFRATPQWFISMEANNLRERALHAISHEVAWIPKWGRDRIHSMVENRPDWCVSRQRNWGVPIAVFICRECGEIITDGKIQERVAAAFKEHGADAWYDFENERFLGRDFKCPRCGSLDIRKEMDILDVWFDSGTSHAAVCEEREELKSGADMYLEGTDQHRGWFHSSLLESVATRGKAPFKEVLTHGFVVDDDLQKMSKSKGNALTPEELIKKHGAEIIRLWVSSEDYTGDVRISEDIMKRLVESYRKIRNTARFILGNLYDFDADKDTLPFEELKALDKYILFRWREALKKILEGYKSYQFHLFYHSFLNFCVGDLSSFYLDIIKDRVYSFAAASKERRSAQTALFHLIKEMARVIAPVLSFTADEVWEYIPNFKGKREFVFEELFPDTERFKDEDAARLFSAFMEVRPLVNKALEEARTKKLIGHSLDAKITLKSGLLPEGFDEDLARLFIVGEVCFAEQEEPVKAEPSAFPKCARCWSRAETVDDKGLCKRCGQLVSEHNQAIAEGI